MFRIMACQPQRAQQDEVVQPPPSLAGAQFLTPADDERVVVATVGRGLETRLGQRRKRHSAVDALGLIITIVATAVRQVRRAARLLIWNLHRIGRRVVWSGPGGGYVGKPGASAQGGANQFSGTR